MATSGTYTFNLTVAEALEEAYEQAGLELRSGYDLATGKRSANLLLSDWANDGVHLWTYQQFTTACVADQSTYTLDPQWMDIIDAVLRDSTSTPPNDIPMTRISLSEYLNRPNKSTSGRPTHFAIERNSNKAGHTMYLWNVPDSTNYSVVAYGKRFIQDVGDYDDNLDIPTSALPAFMHGLAYALACKRKDETSPQDRAELLAKYQPVWDLFKFENRERASLFITPAVGRR
jgi:hypothetical protein